MYVITRTLFIVLTWQQVWGRVTVPIVKYNGCMHDGNGNFNLNCTTSQRIYVLNAILGQSVEMCQNEARCCPSSSDCTGDAGTEHVQLLRSKCNGQQECQVAMAKQLCNGHLTDYETVTFVCTTVAGESTAATTTAPTTKVIATKHISTTAIKPTATAETSTTKATTPTHISNTAVKSTNTTTVSSTIKAMTITHISTTARKSTATTTAVHVASTAQNVAAHSSTSSPASSAVVHTNADTVWITTRSTIESTTSMVTRGSTNTDMSSTTDISRKGSSVDSNKFTNTTLLLTVVPCVVAVVAVILFIIYRTTRRTKPHQPLDKPARTTSLYDAITINN